MLFFRSRITEFLRKSSAKIKTAEIWILCCLKFFASVYDWFTIRYHLLEYMQKNRILF